MRISDGSSDVCSSDLSSATTPRRTAGALLECVSGPATVSACRGQGFGVPRDMFSYRPLTDRAGSGADGPSLVTSMPRGQCCRADLSAGRWAFGPRATYCERSEENTSELQSLHSNSYTVFCMNKKI